MMSVGVGFLLYLLCYTGHEGSAFSISGFNSGILSNLGLIQFIFLSVIACEWFT
jgi:hypothetical protein